MYVRLSTGPIHDSGKDPVMVMFSREELAKFKSLPESEDIFISYPDDWDQNKRDQWVKQSRDMIVATLKSSQAKLPKSDPPKTEAPSPLPPQPLQIVPEKVVMQPPVKDEPPAVIEVTEQEAPVVVSNDALLDFLDSGKLNESTLGKTAAVELEASFEVEEESPKEREEKKKE